MQEFTIEINIDEDAEVTAETKGFSGPVCVKALDEVLKNVGTETTFKNKPEFYKKNNVTTNKLTVKN